MASKPAETYCSIEKYIARADPKLHELLDDACVLGLLNSGGKTGITFLHPVDKTWRAKFEKLVHSGNVGDKPAAEDMVRALIIRDTLKTGRDWNASRDNIPNSLFPYQHVPIKSANDREVVFESGARAEPDPGFVDDSRKKNLAVWKLVSGEIPITTDRPAKQTAGGKGVKKGSYEPEPHLYASKRFQIGRHVETEYARDELNRRQKGSRVPSQCYLKYTLSLVNHLITTGNENLLYNRVLPCISYDKFDFYALVEPHSLEGSRLLDDYVIEEWWADAASRKFDIHAMKQKTMEMQADARKCSCAIYAKRSGLLREIHALRGSVLRGRAHESAGAIVEAYKHLESANSLGSISEVFPAELHSYYAANPGLKLTQDELRYISHVQFAALESESVINLGKLNYIFNYMGDRLHAATEQLRAGLRTIVNPASLQYHIKPKEQLSEIQTFTNSTAFVFIPQTEEETRAVASKSTLEHPAPGAPGRFFNIQQAVHEQQIRILPELAQEYNDQVTSWIKTLNPSHLTQESREHLQRLLG